MKSKPALVGCFHDEALVECESDPAVYTQVQRIVKESLIKGYTKYIKSVTIKIGNEETNYEPLIINDWGEAK